MRQHCAALTLLLGATIHAQELIPNGGFEEMLQCPDFQGQMDRTAFWFDPGPATPDYFHACAGNGWFSVPQSLHGFQEPFEGQARAGEFIWIGNAAAAEQREYMEVELLEPLVKDRCYRLRLRVNLADFSGRTTDAFGARFYADSVLLPNLFPPGDPPHIALPAGTFLDRDAWTLLEGEHIASGGERFIMLGNFLFDAQTVTLPLTGGPANTGNWVYVFIDAVSLTPCAAMASTESSSAGAPRPVITDGALRWAGAPEPGSRYRLRDTTGRLVAEGAIGSAPIQLGSAPGSILIVERISRSGSLFYRVIAR
jgi:hypothetical protein